VLVKTSQNIKYLNIKEGWQWEKAISAPSGVRFSGELTEKPGPKRRKSKPKRNDYKISVVFLIFI
jgi:hypothetical protein